MASNDAFLPQTETMLIATNATANTSSTQAVAFPGLAPAVMGPVVPPSVMLVENLSTAVIWLSVTLISNRTAAVPAAGQTTFEVPILPGTAQTFRVPFAPGSSGTEGTAGGTTLNSTPQGGTLYVNTICPTLASAQLAVTFGEGL
jgi:hypothetical protein